ncbi:MAG: thioredoxin family protein [Candidatus Rifleibacteriota bacterium]
MLNPETFAHEIVEKKKTAVLIFSAQWCKPSRLQLQIVDELRHEFSEKAMIEVIDVDQEPALADQFQARTLPTTVLHAQGEIVEILPGYQTLDFLQAYLRHIIKMVDEANAETTDSPA